MIEPAFRGRVEAALATLERVENVRVLLAVESGSRAWGFPSRDSDFNVRFVFVRPLADYLRELLARKLDAAETDTVPRQPVLERFLAESLAVPAPRPAAWEQEAERAKADALFARLTGG